MPDKVYFNTGSYGAPPGVIDSAAAAATGAESTAGVAAPEEQEVSRGLGPAMQQYLARFQPDAVSGVDAGNPVGPVSRMRKNQYAQNVATRAALAGPPDAVSGVNAGDPTGPIQHMREAQHAAAMQWPGAAESGAAHSAQHQALLQNAAANGGELHPASVQIPAHDIREEAIRRSQMDYNIAQSTVHAARMKNAYEQAMNPPKPDPSMMVHAAMAQTLMAPVAAMAVQSTHPTLVPQHIQKMMEADPRMASDYAAQQDQKKRMDQARAANLAAIQQQGQAQMQAQSVQSNGAE